MATVGGKTLRTALISAASGATVVVPGNDSQLIYVASYALVAAGAVVATWQDTSATPVALSGAMSLATGIPVAPATDPPSFVLATTVGGKGLALNLGTAVQVSGHVAYWYE